MENVNQTRNVAAGHIAGRDVVIYSPRRTPITALNERYKAAVGSEEGLQGFIEQIEHWRDATSVDIRPLAQKLKEADRADCINYGEMLKERATRIIMKYQTSRTAQELLSHIMAELLGRFMCEVHPSIQAGVSRVDVDMLFSERVIGQTLNDLEDNVLGIDRTDLMGLMYFLTGNCHVRWDRC